MFTTQEIKIANATSRSNGATAIGKDGTIKAIVPIFINKNVCYDCSILDFGAGKSAIHTKWLKEQGFKNVTAYDFGENCIDGLHDANALSKRYEVVFASNVLNTNSSFDMLCETIGQVYDCLQPGGLFICNYPSSPRKMDLSAKSLLEIITSIFNISDENNIKRVGGTNSAPLLVIQKPFVN